MKIFGVLLLVIASVLVGAGPVGTKIDDNEVDRSAPMSANMNNYVDIIMIQIGPWMNQNFVPIDLPDFIEGFEHRPIIITYHGEIELTNGVFHSIQSVVRSGTAMMHYDRKVLRVVLGANIRQLGFTYDYSAHIMDLGPSGWVDVDIATMTFEFEFGIDLSNFFIYLDHFQLTNIGNLNIRFRGNILVDWLSNIFVGIITTIFNNTITNIVSNSLHSFIQATLDEMNARVQAQGRALTEQELTNLVYQLKHMF
ncbi:uncharacterized protein LOC109421107 [Aedes albopictus]|uniref:Hemolymph juvenile hormone binding protein n=1 Tax=Aedes albopictus TaxID=7160 RepID=A0ABM1Z395_AEDAL|nr:uncharacterized protein LOC109421107 [Aedes albopictus]XP_029714124.1 uncharacterized protein LOC115258198 [Aedes albopictus]KXJ76549.1 hypothetical protein RP20_CCG009457 [Aedes albopictus]